MEVQKNGLIALGRNSKSSTRFAKRDIGKISKKKCKNKTYVENLNFGTKNLLGIKNADTISIKRSCIPRI